MLRASYILAIAILLGLTGCVQARINAYYNPKHEPCQTAIKVENEWKYCVSHEHAWDILKQNSPVQP